MTCCLYVSGREWSDWSSELRIPGDELKWKFTSDGSVNGWGWRFTVYPIMPAAGELQQTCTKNGDIGFSHLKLKLPVREPQVFIDGAVWINRNTPDFLLLTLSFKI